MTPLSEHKAAERDRIARAADQFFKSGGRIERLPGPALAPPPPRWHPKPQPKKPRKVLMPAHIKRYRESGPKIIELFERGLSFKQIAAESGRSDKFVISCLDYYAIDAVAVRAEQKTKANADMIEQIRLLAADGHSTRYIGEQLGISASKVLYHGGRNEIRFRKE